MSVQLPTWVPNRHVKQTPGKMELANLSPSSFTSPILENDAMVRPAVPTKNPGAFWVSCFPHLSPTTPSNHPASPTGSLSELHSRFILLHTHHCSPGGTHHLLSPTVTCFPSWPCHPLSTQQHRDIAFQVRLSSPALASLHRTLGEEPASHLGLQGRTRQLAHS